MDVKEVSLEGKLSQLASKLATDFLKDRITARDKKLEGTNIIYINNHEQEVLDYLKVEMQRYFDSQEEGVEVRIGKDGYTIDVRRFLS